MAYSTIGYHTCRDEGGLPFLKREAPFEADQEQEPFLSLGFYFWQYSEDDAHYWGRSRKRFPKGYAICRCQLKLFDLLDLNNPDDLFHIQELEQEMIDCGRLPDERLPVGELIQWLRDFDDDEIFSYDSVRMRQDPPKDLIEERIYATSQPNRRLVLNPQYIICAFNKERSVTSCSIIFPEHYRGR